jgi:hypothetical protein
VRRPAEEITAPQSSRLDYNIEMVGESKTQLFSSIEQEILRYIP